MYTEDTLNNNTQNALLLEAQAVLQPINQLAQSTQPEQHYEALCQSVTQFESQCNHKAYSRAEINDACFFLCALLDDITPWQTPFIARFCDADANKDTEFYIRLKRRQESPEQHIDLLEIAYLCLSLGFKGQYSDDRLITLMDDLYQQIQQQRDQPATSLFQQKKPNSMTSWCWPPLWLTILIAAVILTFIFVPYQQKLNQYTTPAIKILTDITKTTE